MAAEQITFIEERNVLGLKFKWFRVQGPTSYLQSTGQVIKRKDLGFSLILSAHVGSQPVTDSDGTDYGLVGLTLPGAAVKGGLQVDVEAHWVALGSTERADATNLSAKSFQLLVIGV